MIDIIDLVVNKETIVRKRVASFIEKLFNYIEADFKHDTYKAIVYSEAEYITNLEIKMKMVYDSFMYLLFNRKNQLSLYVLNTFFQIYLGYKLDDMKVHKICNKYFLLYDETPIDKAILFSSFIRNELKDLEKEDNLFISLIMLNYCLAACEIPCIKLTCYEIETYVKLVDEYNEAYDISKLYMFIVSIIKKQKFQDKNHYKNLRELNAGIIYQEINLKIDEIKDKFNVKQMYLYGSYAKNENRRDSDLDLIVSFNLDLLKEEKDKLRNDLIKYLFDMFKTYVDIHELTNYIPADSLIENRKIKKLI